MSTRDVRWVRAGAVALSGARDGGRAAALDAGRRARRRGRPPALRERARGAAGRQDLPRAGATGRRRSRSIRTARSMPDRPPPFPLLTGPGGAQGVALGRSAARLRARARPRPLGRARPRPRATRGVIVATVARRARARSPGSTSSSRSQLPRRRLVRPRARIPRRRAAATGRFPRRRSGYRGSSGRSRPACARRAGHARLGFTDHTISARRTGPPCCASMRLLERSWRRRRRASSGEPAGPRGAARARHVLVGRVRGRARPDAACACSRASPSRTWTCSASTRRRNRVVVILVTGDTVEWQLGRALGAAADVASWDRERLMSVDTELDGVDGTRVARAGAGRRRVRPARAGHDRLARQPPRRAGLRLHRRDGALRRASGCCPCGASPAERGRPRQRGRVAAAPSGSAAAGRTSARTSEEPPPDPDDAEAAGSQSLAEEQAEHAPELVGAPRSTAAPRRIRTTSASSVAARAARNSCHRARGWPPAPPAAARARSPRAAAPRPPPGRRRGSGARGQGGLQRDRRQVGRRHRAVQAEVDGQSARSSPVTRRVEREDGVAIRGASAAAARRRRRLRRAATRTPVAVLGLEAEPLVDRPPRVAGQQQHGLARRRAPRSPPRSAPARGRAPRASGATATPPSQPVGPKPTHAPVPTIAPSRSATSRLTVGDPATSVCTVGGRSDEPEGVADDLQRGGDSRRATRGGSGASGSRRQRGCRRRYVAT